MASKDFKVNESITVIYRAATVVSSVDMSIYDETQSLVTTSPMTQIGTSTRWSDSFTPDAVGDWHVEINDSDGATTIKAYSVGGYNLDDVGALADTLETKVDALDTKIDALQSPPQIG